MLNKVVRLFVSSPEHNRDNNINIIRCIAAVMVIYGHMAHLIDVPVPTLFGEKISTIAVKVFFVISGYLITQSFLRDGHYFRYMVRRVCRIFPGLIFVSFATAFLIGPVVSSLPVTEYLFNRQTVKYFVHNSVLYPDYFLPGVFSENPYPDAVNGSLWTLPVEFAMYILLPFFVVVFRKLNILKGGLVAATVIFSILDVAYLSFFPEARFVIWGSNIFQGLVLVPYFFAGSLFTFDEIKSRLNLQVGVLFAFLIGSVMLEAYWQTEFALLLLLPYITLACALTKPAFFGRVFATEDYSYGLYLWGFPVQQLLVYLFGADAFSLLGYTIVSFFVAFLASMISWFLVEKPGGRLGKKITSWSRNKQVNQA